ncbi:tumor necrosis factor receptor superfamily member 1A [Diretmus argenteus]
MIGIGVLVVSVLLLVSITYKATKQCSDTSPDPSPDACDASPDSTKILMLTEDPDDDKCNSAVPQHPVSDQEPTNLPDCIPLEIKIPDLIYTVLDLVPVQQMKQLARSLGLTDIEIERAETDHRACQEAHYQMLRVWAERGSRVAGGGGGGRGGVLHRPLMQELMDNLMKMHLGGAAEELEAKYGIQ